MPPFFPANTGSEVRLKRKPDIIILIGEDLGAVEADTAHDGEHGLDEADVEHGLCELEVAKVAWALGHPSHTCLALGPPVNGAQTRVAQTTRLGLPLLHGLWMLYHRH